MTTTPRFWLIVGAISAALAVVFGAFAAHGLETHLQSLYGDADAKSIVGFQVPAAWKYLQDFKTGSEYQMTHSLGLIAIGLLAFRMPGRALWASGWCLLFGIVFFSGSLYVLVLTKTTWLGAVAALGGTLMIAGWLLMAIAVGKASASFPAPEG